MKQLSFSAAEHQSKKVKTKKECFLEEMDHVIPWNRLLKAIQPHYHLEGGRGQQPYPLEPMLRIYFLQQWYALSDPGTEEALYDMEVMRHFAGVGSRRIPDETTILNFRRLLERHDLPQVLLAEVNRHLEDKGLLCRQGTIVDATLIHAPSSTKNRDKRRDPKMSSTKKNNQWYFGMKSHIGVDAQSGLVHSTAATPAKTHDSQMLDDLLHGQERDVHGDKAYSSKARCLGNSDPQTRIWCMPYKKPNGGALPEWQQEINHQLSRLRAKVEHPFRVIKCQFGYRKVRYRGLRKNHQQQQSLYMLANLYLVRKQLLV